MIRAAIPALALALAVVAPGAARAQQIVVDLSRDLVAITTGFAGAQLVLFGAMEGDGEVIVVVKGPPSERTVRRKNRVAGIWINTESVTFRDVPSFYAVATTKPAEDLLLESEARNAQIGLAALRFGTDSRLSAAATAEFRAALLRNLQREGVYAQRTGRIVFVGGKLFRADIAFPANVPVGSYEVQAYLVRNGRIAQAFVRPLFVNKTGLSAEVFDFADRRGFTYGIAAVLLASLAGFAAANALRRL
jgi:uncharacterized protein (TIGR02186 family)